MPGLSELADLVTLVRQRSDMENTTFIADTELERYIEGSLGELWDIIIEEGGADHFIITSEDHATVSGTDTYDIMSDIDNGVVAPAYKIVGVDAKFNGKWRRLRNFSFWQRNQLEDTSGWNNQGSVRYRVFFTGVGKVALTARPGARVRFIPTPQGVHNFRIHYIPHPEDWSSGGFVAFQGYSGWEEFIVVDAAAKVLEKEESDATHLYQRKAMAIDRIRHHSRTMNHGEGDRIRDIHEDLVLFEEYLPGVTS